MTPTCRYCGALADGTVRNPYWRPDAPWSWHSMHVCLACARRRVPMLDVTPFAAPSRVA